MAEHFTVRKLKHIRSSNGGEYISNDFENVCKQHGIDHIPNDVISQCILVVVVISNLVFVVHCCLSYVFHVSLSFLIAKMDSPSTNSTANEEEFTESHIPSFFQNSLCPGEPFCAEKSTAFEIEMAEMQNVQEGPEEEMLNESKMVRSGGGGGKVDSHAVYHIVSITRRETNI